MAYSEKDLQEFLDSQRLSAKIIHLKQRVKKVEDAEAAIAVNKVKILKAMAIMLNESEPLLCIIRGDCRLDLQKVSKALGASEVRFASRKETLSHIGYDIGSIPPIGHRNQVRTIIDRKVMGNSVVYAGGGSDKCLLEIEVEDIIRLQGAYSLDIT